MSDVRWQGGCELVGVEEGARIGSLYVTSEDVIFIEAGRGGARQYRRATNLLILAGALFVVPLAAEVYAWTYAGGARPTSVAVIEVVCGLLALVTLALAGVWAKRLKADYVAGLSALGEGDAPAVPMLLEAVEAVPGSQRLATADVESMREEDGRLKLETRLGEVWDLLVLPSAREFRAAVESGKR